MFPCVRKCIFVVMVWFFAFLFISKDDEKYFEMKVEKEDEIVEKDIYVEVNGEAIELEAYLIGVVASEMPYTFEMEALKAQSVAARTFVLQRGLKVDNTTNTQVYKSEAELKEIHDENYEALYNKVKEAVYSTKNEVLKYNNEYISALFYSCNNGKSNDCSWYFSGNKPYLKCVDSPWDKEYDGYKVSIEKEKEEICNALGISSFSIGEKEYYENGYVKSIKIGGKKFSGREVREILNLRSSCFYFEEFADDVFIYTEGYGHGVGMSQYGANGMAKVGYSYEEILKHYYTGVQIEKIQNVE